MMISVAAMRLIPTPPALVDMRNTSAWPYVKRDMAL